VKFFYSDTFRLGILGGGQLGRMLLQEAANYDVRTAVLDPASDAPCSAISHEFTCGSFQDFDTVLAFGKGKDVLTVEIEHVNTEALEELEKCGIDVFPAPSFLRMVQDKGLQKEFYSKNNIPTAPYQLIESTADLKVTSQTFPFVLKSRKGGYDGKGVQIVRSQEELNSALSGPCVVEELIPFEKELSIIIARNKHGETRVFPLVEMEFNQDANLVEFLFSPAQVKRDIEMEAQSIATTIVEASNFVGLLAVELFLTQDGNLLVNEMAPRPHNSGHHTIEACTTSQYDHEGPVQYRGLEEALTMPGVHIHIYGKPYTKPFRKMGHVTVTDSNLSTAQQRARSILELIRIESC